MRRSSASQLRDALARLPEEQRQAVELAYFGGRTTYREIAVLTGVPQGTATAACGWPWPSCATAWP